MTSSYPGAPGHPIPVSAEIADIAAASQAGRALGLSVAGAVVVRRAATVQVRLPKAGAVVRVHPPAGMSTARREVRIGMVLAAAAVPAMRLVPGHQPVITSAGPATVWGWLDSTGSDADLPALASVAIRLHAATAELASSGLPCLDPIGATVAALSGMREDPDAALLQSIADGLRGRWPRLVAADPLGTSIVHGDLHPGNVVMTAAGPVLVDLELAGVGPRSYDLAAIAVAGRRYGAPVTEVDAAFLAYGSDPRAWSGFEVLCEIYELWVTAWAVAHRSVSDAADVEARRRTALWRDGESPGTWTVA